MTVLEVLQSTTAYFQKRAIESPRLNAEHLVAHSLGKKRIELYLEFERALSEPELAPLRELVRRRGQGEPLQHLVGTVEFANHTFVTDRRALIPRPETEQLVEYLCDLTWPEAPRMLDVGTGSGVIVLSLAARFPKAELHAVDLSAGRARARPGKCGAARFAGSHPFLAGPSARPDRRRSFDLIVANLPYVAASEAKQLAPEVRHDPPIALYGGETGDELIRELIAAAPPYLRPGGTLALEIGIDQQEGLSDVPDDEELQRHSVEKRLCRNRSIPLRAAWIKFSFTAVIRSLVRSRSAGRKTRLFRSWPRPC